MQATGTVLEIKRCVISGYRDGFAFGMAEEASVFVENIRTRDAIGGLGAFFTGLNPDFD